MTPARVGSCLWLLCFQFFVAEQLARLGWAGHYSMSHNYISDLGALSCASGCSSLHWLMNSSFVLQGLLIFFGALLLRTFLGTIPLVLLLLAGLGVLLVGLVPEGTHFPLHLVGAVANFLGGNLAMILLGISASRWRGWITPAAGCIGLAATLALAFHTGWDAGTVERLAAYPLPLWLTWSGWRMLRA